MNVDLRSGLRAPVVRFALTHIRRAGNICRRYFRSSLSVEYKGDGSPVTVADRTVERYLTRAIRRACPDHTIVGEEYAPDGMQAGGGEAGAGDDGTAESGGYRWYIDPIDGTQAFVHRIPLYTCLLALYRGDEPLLAIIYNPELHELAVAIAGGGCYFNGKRTRVGACAELDKARLLYTDVSLLFRAAPASVRSLPPLCATTRTWCDAYGYLLLATGRADLIVETGLKSWDIAPLYLIVEEAGGTISALDGKRAPLGSSCIASTPQLHARAVAHVKR